jgi:hypothetical protein
LNHTFSAPLIKIARARKHLAELEAEIGVFLLTEPAHWTDPRSRGRIASQALTRLTNRVRALTRHTAGVKDGAPESPIQLTIVLPPEHLGAIIGDIIHNLRSALDLVACDLVRAAEGKDATVERVYFPFCQSAEDLEGMIRTRQFDRAGDRAVQVLCGLKPYRGGNAALRAIHDLDVQDKHTSLILAKTSVAIPIVRTLDNDGTPSIALGGKPPKISKITAVFPPGSVLAGHEIIPTLHQLVELAFSIIKTFRALANS